MPALVAMRFTPDLKAKYAAPRAAGNPAKLAIVAFGGAVVHRKAALPASLRKLIEIANALVKADRAWIEKTV